MRRAVLGGLAALGLVDSQQSKAPQTAGPDLSQLPPEKRARYTEMRARMMAALSYERVTVPGAQAISEWENLRRSGRGWPVVVGGDEDLERIADQFSMEEEAIAALGSSGHGPRTPGKILATASGIQFPRDLRKWPGAYRPEDLQAPLGPWPTTVEDPGPGLSVASDLLSGKPRDKVHILLVPASNSWEVPAYLRWGNWNACPPPEYHVAALRSLHDRFGAELIGINGDTLNVRVDRPPSDRKQAVALARELYGYCPDIVDQGVTSISALAASLMASRWWYFWWD